ncbi:MAG: aminotransferase [Hyphomicrobiaceae bacterium]|nr:aminotransferase [Hyphomicrobiaceae bacterium]
MNAKPNSLAARDIEYLMHPQTNLKLHRDVGPNLVDHGGGVWITDADGNRLLDAMSGLWCASLGYTSARLARVAFEQMQKLSYGHLYKHNSHEPAIELAEKLLEIAPPHMSKVHFQNSGSEANDVAIKLVWYYQNAIGKPEKRKIISRHGAYHGSSVATVSLTGKPDMHEKFNLPLDGFLHTDCPYYFRDGGSGESEEAYASRLAENLNTLIEDEGPETVAAFFAEPVLGSAGAISPPATYFEKIQAVLKKHDVLFIADEVITGFGRTGNMWGSETFALMPDMMTCAKALSAAALPISAVIISDHVYEALVAQSDRLGGYAHGHTYAGHPVSAAVALEVQKIYEEMDVVSVAQRLGVVLEETLAPFADHPMVGQIDRTGMMAGMELVADKDTRTAFADELGVPARVGRAARENGLIIKSIGSRIAFAPAFVTSEEEIAEFGLRLGKALDAVHKDVCNA